MPDNVLYEWNLRKGKLNSAEEFYERNGVAVFCV